ncbi:olfactory receptor 5V1-like [Pelobates fuscus]|uniref:olfactory receptor 5V1-like n=1 Tax=Pelobates fuscus TaxID=191477 RepID=UPI002FE472AA
MIQEWNQTRVSEFIFIGISSNRELQLTFFILLLVVYLLCLFGYLAIIIVVKVDPHLQTPMYFFLSHFSFLEMCFTSNTIPKLLYNLLTENNHILFEECIVQMFFFLSFVTIDCLLLTVMSYDRFVAICCPLHYNNIMTKTICNSFTTVLWSIGFVYSAIHTSVLLQLPFCGPNEIDHFFCDFPIVLKLSCSDTFLNHLLMSVTGSLLGFSCLLMILRSYINIITAVVKIRFSERTSKAFSTCTSHLTVVSLYYGTLIFTYLPPPSNYSLNYDKVVALVYCIGNPMLNSIIYSLNNKEVKGAFKKLLQL